MHLPVRERIFAAPASRGHLFPINRMPPERQVYLAFIFLGIAVDEGCISFLNFVPLELTGQALVRLIRFGHNQQSRCFFVETMYDPRSQDAADAGKVRAMVKDGIHNCILKVTRSRMYDHSRRFVNHQDVLIFVNDRQGKVLR
jgi:hypothetical protein